MTATTNQLSATRVIDAATNEILDVLTLPQRHPEFDGTGMVRSDEKSQRIQQVGDTFTMNMHNEVMGDYQMENHVVAFADNQLVGWQPSSPGKEPGGWEWVYELNAIDGGSTEATLTYDWSKVTDPSLLRSFPVTDEAGLEESLNQLAAAVSS
jgi:hypothetical protein